MKQIIVIAVFATGFLIGMCLVEFHKYITVSTAYALDLRRQVDSLTMEIQLRDVLLSKCKDTSYGEEPIYK